jgi:transcriptional antiterminator RfaH
MEEGSMAEAIELKFSSVARAAIAQADERIVRQLPVKPMSSSPRWHIVHVAAAFERGIADPEHFIAKEIKRVGFEVYSARLRKMVMPMSRNLSHAQRQHRHLLARERIEPLFPGYEFIRFDPVVHNWHSVFGMIGVFGMLCAGNLPVPMPDAFIDGLRAREVNGAIPAEIPVLEVFAIGEQVRISRDCSFKGLMGTIGRLDSGGRIRLLLDFFGGKTLVELTAADVEKP